MKNLAAFKEYLSETRNAVLVTHVKPDADALGSSLGLAAFLKKKGHTVKVITPSDYPGFLSWMPGNDGVLIFSKEAAAQAEQFVKNADVIFCLDFSALSRINELGDMVKNAAAKKVLIDHHLEPEQFADFEHWNPKAASTAGLVYELIEMLGETDAIDSQIAECLYAGLMTDTGGFRHSNTRQQEFLIASELVARGADPSRISKLVYDTNTIERLRLMGYVLSKKLVVLPQYNTAYMALTESELRAFGSQSGDTEGLVNYGLSIKGIVLSTFILERKDHIKLSFRSLGDFNVNEFARHHFEGGGHKNAAGGQTMVTLNETIGRFLDLLPQYKEQLNTSF